MYSMCITATLEPNVGLYTARDEDQKVEWELVRRMEDVVAQYREEGAAYRRELETILRQVETEAILAGLDPAPSPACHIAPKRQVSTAQILRAAQKVMLAERPACHTVSTAPIWRPHVAPNRPPPREKPAAAALPILRRRALLRLVEGAALAPRPLFWHPGGQGADACSTCPVSPGGGEADACSPCPMYRPWAGSQGATAVSPTYPASGETLQTTTPIGSTSGEARGTKVNQPEIEWMIPVIDKHQVVHFQVSMYDAKTFESFKTDQ
ncbi:unnamed protein product [Pleuronectes platessa]|uniref:Uncharacterized protein n=1 Tax=Pleuronectes platessa TaxID=8262 RepID=A0A9N7UZJ6_PLEPL|nr:unnamed protein product [Pleuronectes platessa]